MFPAAKTMTATKKLAKKMKRIILIASTAKMKMIAFQSNEETGRTIVRKDQPTEEQKKRHGQYSSLGRKTKQQIKNSAWVELPGIGHIQRLQDTDLFIKHLLAVLK